MKIVEELGEDGYLKILYNPKTGKYSVTDNGTYVICEVDYDKAYDKAIFLCYTQR